MVVDDPIIGACTSERFEPMLPRGQSMIEHHWNGLVLSAVVALSCHGTPPPENVEATPATEPDTLAMPTPDTASPVPEVQPSLVAKLPSRLWLDFEVDHDHGCSRSHVSRGLNGRVSLDIHSDSDVRFSIALRENRVFGPSRGAFSQGDRDFTYTRKALTRVFRGHFERDVDELSVVFDTIENATAEAGGHADLQLPPPTKVQARAELICREGTVEAYDPVSDGPSYLVTEGQTPSATPVLLCRIADELFDLENDIMVDGSYPLASDPGLTVKAFSMFSRRTVVYRRGRHAVDGERGSGPGH